MESKAFSVPQRQSLSGVILIFFSTLLKILRGFWVVAVYLLINTPSGPVLFYSLLGFGVFVLLVFVYSFLYYQNFLFHIDYENEEFRLQKGVIATENIAIPFDKIQQVYFKRSILQRLIGVYSVAVDTAGSKEDEVSISAISKEDADQLLTILTKAKEETAAPGPDAEISETTETEELWTHKLDILTLLKIGISTNYLRGFALVLAFFTTIYNELNTFFEDYAEELGEYYERVPGPADSISFFLILLVLLLFISILITVLEVFIKYFGLKLIQTRKNLELEMGLKTNTKVSLQPRRVQLMQVLTNPVQKRMNLYEARIALASSENALQKKKIKIPGLEQSTVEKVRFFLFGNFTSSFEESFRPHIIILFRRSFLVLIPIVVSYLLLLWSPYISFESWLILAGIFLILGTIYQVLWFKSLQLIFTEDFLQKKQAVWNKREDIFEIYKMQAVTIKQPIWYKRRNLVNVNFHTAGGDISFKAVNKKILPFINYILYKVESSGRKWM